MTMTLVSTVQVGSGGAASIDFTSLPQTGTDLYLSMSLRNSAGAVNTIAYINVNGSSSSYSGIRLLGDGSTSSSSTESSGFFLISIPGSGGTASTFGSASLYIPNYAGSTNKTASLDSVTENNASSAIQRIAAGLWSNTAAITSLSISTGATLLQYSTASLYTITKGSGGATVS